MPRPPVPSDSDRVAAEEPKYAVIRDWLKSRIIAGSFARGERLPTESALMGQFGVSRVTVRLALDGLRRAGLIEGRQGKGYFVRPVRMVQDLGRLQGFGEMMAPLGVEVRSEVVEFDEVPPSREVQRALRLDRSDLVVRVQRLRIAGGAGLSYDISHFPLEVGRRLRDLDLAHADIFALLERELGHELGYADLTLEVVAADEDLATRLGARSGDPLVRLVRLTYDLTGRPIDFEYLYGRPDAFQFRVRVPRW